MDNVFNRCGLHKVEPSTAQTMIDHFNVYNMSLSPQKKLSPDVVFLSKVSLDDMLMEMESKGHNCVQLRLGLLNLPLEKLHLTWLMQPIHIEEQPNEKYKIISEGSWYASESPEVEEPEPIGVTNPPYTPAPNDH